MEISIMRIFALLFSLLKRIYKSSREFCKGINSNLSSRKGGGGGHCFNLFSALSSKIGSVEARLHHEEFSALVFIFFLLSLSLSLSLYLSLSLFPFLMILFLFLLLPSLMSFFYFFISRSVSVCCSMFTALKTVCLVEVHSGTLW